MNEQKEKMLESALQGTNQTLSYLLKILNNSEDVKWSLKLLDVSVPYLVINHTYDRNDRNVKHLQEAWNKNFAMKVDNNVLSFQDFCFTRTYLYTKDMGLDELGQYHSMMGMIDDCEVDVVYRGIIIYAEDYYITQYHDGGFNLLLGNNEYNEDKIELLEKHLYDFYLSEAGQ